MAHEKIDFMDRITTDPKVLVGKPVVKGTRIPVELVLAKLAHNPDLDELFVAYPELTKDARGNAGKKAGMFSRVNTLLSIPMLFCMVGKMHL